MQKKLIIAVIALSLVLCCFVGGTVAWLVAQSEEVTNTFTVGNIQITLTETTGSGYKIIPGDSVDKDPLITVMAESEKCYVYVVVENNLVINGKTVATPNINLDDWIPVGESGTKVLYRYKEEVDATKAKVELPVFTKVTFADSEITAENISEINNKTIVMRAYAHQSENITNVTVADKAAITWAGVVAIG